jgi:hypothetical protein
MLYTPLSEQKKRSTKTLIDVGFDRIGTLMAAGIAVAALAVAGARAELILLVFAVACALVTLARSRALHRGYVSVLEESLRTEATKAGVATPHPSSTSEVPGAIRDAIVGQLDKLRHTTELAAIATGDTRRASELSREIPRAATHGQALESLEASLPAVVELGSRDPDRIRRVLSAAAPLAPPLVSFAILLLADKESHADAVRALRKCAPKATGQLVDALCDDCSELDVRRRIPRVLSECPTQAAADGLVRGISDSRFEVRYECARALLRITERDPHVVVDPAKVIALVTREVALSKKVWESQREPELDEEEDEPPALIDRLLRDRVDRSLEHVFTLLALNLDRQSLRLAFKALHESDERLRGTALEYLETVLPDEVRDAVWPFLGEQRPMRPARPPLEILADLRRLPEALARAPASDEATTEVPAPPAAS